MYEKYGKLQEIIDNSNYIVFFGGAGVSTASNIPDFRSAEGLYNKEFSHPPEVIISDEFFYANTKEFYDFYTNNMIFTDAKPNACHTKLGEMEKAGKLKAIVTQNIDNLHQLGGAEKVYELHGSVYRNNCILCNKFFDVHYVLDSGDIPVCDECGGIVKPDVVLYGEALDQGILRDAIHEISKADTLIIGGTSLGVYPAAGMINYFNGKNLVLINKSSTPRDRDATLLINDDISKVFENIKV